MSQQQRLSLPNILERAAPVSALLTALIGSWYLISTPGTPDVPDYWFRWMGIMREHGLIDGYKIAYSDYMPGAFVVLRLVDIVAAATGLNVLFVLKGTLLLFAALSVAIVWLWHRSWWWIAGLSWALLLSSIGHAYLDVLYLPALLLALHWLQRERHVAASAAFTVALAMKWQPLIIAPVLLIPVLRRSRYSRVWGVPYPSIIVDLARGAVIPVIILVATFGAAPTFTSFKLALSHRALSFQGLNLGWAMQFLIAKCTGFTKGALFELPPPTIAVLALKLLFVASYAFVCVFLWRKGRNFADTIWCATTAALLYFAFNTGVHENHLFVAMAFAFALAPAGSAAARALAWMTAIALNLNLLLFYGMDGRTPLPTPHFGGVSVSLALLNVGAAVLCLLETSRRWRTTPDCPAGSVVLPEQQP